MKAYKVAKNKSTFRGSIQEERLLTLLLHLLYLLNLISSVALLLTVDGAHSGGTSMAAFSAVKPPAFTNFI